MTHRYLTPSEGFGNGPLWQTLTDQYYLWEIRGRGWLLWNFPVQIEPPYRPFELFIPQDPNLVDDGRVPTLFSRVIDGAKSLFKKKPSRASQPYTPFDNEVLPEQYLSPTAQQEFVIAVPPEYECSPTIMAKFFMGLSACHFPVSFEVIGNSEQTIIVLGCRCYDAPVLENQIISFFPRVVVTSHIHYLISKWKSEGIYESVIVDFGLCYEFMRPLQTMRTFDNDPLIGVMGAMSGLRTQEVSVLQIIFQPVRHPWHSHIARSVSDGDYGCLFANAPEMLPLTKEKLSHPLFSVLVRIGVKAEISQRAWQLAQMLGTTFKYYDRQGSNHLIPLDNEDYDEGIHEAMFLNRLSHRSGMILNAQELVALAHLPSSTVYCEKLLRTAKRTKQVGLTAHGDLRIGVNEHRSKETTVTLAPQERLRHMHIIGGSGTGKSTLLLNMMIQDMEANKGFAVFDPHGDLIEGVLAHIPDHRRDDVIIFDPSDSDYPLGFNILSANNDIEKTLLSSDLTAVFRRLATTWGDQMTSILSNAILAFLESSEGGTLIGLRRFLIDHTYRSRFLQTVDDPEVLFYWNKEFPILPKQAHYPILTRLDTFLRSKMIRNIVAQHKGKLNFSDVMNSGKIFLAKLSHGYIGEENSYLLGSLLISKFHQTAMARQDIPEAERKPFYVYIDEMQNFVTPSLSGTLSGVRKYGLGLVLAHHEMRQLASVSADVASAVMTHPYIRVCFRLGDEDARKFASGFSFFEAKDLQNLGIGDAICRINIMDNDFNLKTDTLPQPNPNRSESLKYILEQTRTRYTIAKAEVEDALKEERGTQATPPKGDKSESVRPTETTIPPPTTTSPLPPKPIHTKPVVPSQQGKGGIEHVRLQNHLKKAGEELGFRSIIERQVTGGSIDISFEKDNLKIACEISITTGSGHEVENVLKCLNAGYEHVMVIGQTSKKVDALNKAIRTSIADEDLEKIMVIQPDDCAVYLNRLGAKMLGEQKTVRGYKVKTKYIATPTHEQRQKKEDIAKVFLSALKRRG